MVTNLIFLFVISFSSSFVQISAYQVFTNLRYSKVPFDMTRKITGYLVGNPDRFNVTRHAEVEARVKYSTSL